MTNVAALYVLASGPYATMTGVDPWPEKRDATLYLGPDPVVAHPPCAHWGRLAARTSGDKAQHPRCAVFAVTQVQRWGGVLEHPAASRLWEVMDLPVPEPYRQRTLPGPERDAWGGWTLTVEQSSWGHTGGHKPTWLYIVGVEPEAVNLPAAAARPKIPDELVDRVASWKPKLDRRSGRQTGNRCAMDVLSPTARKRTPDAFARWLVEVARRSVR